jgi:hypothetical protein
MLKSEIGALGALAGMVLLTGAALFKPPAIPVATQIPGVLAVTDPAVAPLASLTAWPAGTMPTDLAPALLIFRLSDGPTGCSQQFVVSMTPAVPGSRQFAEQSFGCLVPSAASRGLRRRLDANGYVSADSAAVTKLRS